MGLTYKSLHSTTISTGLNKILEFQKFRIYSLRLGMAGVSPSWVSVPTNAYVKISGLGKKRQLMTPQASVFIASVQLQHPDPFTDPGSSQLPRPLGVLGPQGLLQLYTWLQSQAWCCRPLCSAGCPDVSAQRRPCKNCSKFCGCQCGSQVSSAENL